MTTTSYSPRTPASASLYEGRKYEDDLGIGLDYDGALMCDEDGYPIVFHTGLFSTTVPSYSPRPIVSP